MKVSNKILWGAIGCLFGCVVALLIFIRVSTAPLMEKIGPQPHMTGSRELVDRSYPLKYFSGIQASGKWNLELKKGDVYAIDIRIPEYLLEGVIVEKDKDTLVLGTKKGWRTKDHTLYAAITFPSLQRLLVSGSTDVQVDGFNCERLKIKASGSTRIKGDGIQVYYLTVKGSGSIDVDFQGSPINYAELDLSGSSKIQMTMAGGDLTGKISGSGKVIYDGEVRHQEVKISGSGSIQRRKSTV